MTLPIVKVAAIVASVFLVTGSAAAGLVRKESAAPVKETMDRLEVLATEKTT